MNEPLVPRLRAHDERLRRVPLSLSADTRLRRALFDTGARREPRKHYGPSIAIAFGALLLAVALLVRHRPTDTIAHENAASVFGAGCTVRQRAHRTELSGRCTLQTDAISLESEQDAVVLQQGHTSEVVRGRVRFVVNRVPAGKPPVRVSVRGGVIEVVGTEFLVIQGAMEGTVVVVEGRVRFTSPGRVPIELAAGERFTWTDSEAAKSTHSKPLAHIPVDPLPPKTTGHPATAGAIGRATSGRKPVLGTALPTNPSSIPPDAVPHIDDAIESAMNLRVRGQYQDAVGALDAVDEEGLGLRAREVLSYEKGTLLLRMGEAERACAHWVMHLDRFPRGRYRAEVERKLAEQCPGATPGN